MTKAPGNLKHLPHKLWCHFQSGIIPTLAFKIICFQLNCPTFQNLRARFFRAWRCSSFKETKMDSFDLPDPMLPLGVLILGSGAASHPGTVFTILGHVVKTSTARHGDEEAGPRCRFWHFLIGQRERSQATSSDCWQWPWITGNWI